MSIKEISNKVNSLGNAWENFKQVNDARLREVERKGNADPLYMEQLDRISNVLDNQKSRMNQLETAAMRPEKEITFATKSENPSEYTKAFKSYLRKGATSQLEGAEMKALSVGSATDGGYLVTPKLSDTIHKIVFESSPLRQIAGIEQISTDSLDIIVDNSSMAAGWTTETGAITETNSATIHKESISTFELYAQP
jgi:HK97 family phage major capsid protein